MEIKFLSGEVYPENTTEYAVCLGVFDGVHIGHRKLIEKTVYRAQTQGIKSAVVSFFSPGKNNCIYPVEQQAQLVEMLGIDTLFIILMDDVFKKMQPEEFIRKYIFSYMKAKNVICGYDYRFGINRCGNVETIKELSLKYGYETDIINEITCNGKRISSSLIREFISNGEINLANEMLGDEFFIEGCVTEGFRLGRTIGYPTANVKLPSELVKIKKGVYSTVVTVDGKEHKGLTNIGVGPTVGNNTVPLCETYIPDFERNIYNKYIKIVFKSYLREEKKFENVDELKNAIAENVRMLVNG